MVSRTSKRYSRRARRLIGSCLAILMMAQGMAPGWGAIKQLPKNLMPGPGNAGIVLNLLGVRDGRAIVTTNQHPLFDVSWMGSPSEIVAETKYGPVTSADLYLWMTLRESPNKAYLYSLYKNSKLPEERKKLAEALRVEVDEFVFTNYVIPRIMPAAAPDAIYDLKHEIYTLPAWQTVFLEKVIKPRVCVTEADRQKFLQEHTATIVKPERLRTRYIFMNSPETAPAEEQDRVEVEMDELRSSILRGETDFAAAARAHSQAASASNGGEIPPFGHGELFFRFEDAAANLEPGAISPVFRGPNGFYMVQLIEVLEADKPSLSDPEQAKEVDEGLSRQVLKGAFDIYMRDMLEERRRIEERVSAWDSLEEQDMIGKVCDFMICKGQFRSAWPNVESNDLHLRTDLISTQLRAILEREAMAQDVRELGFANDPILERARWMAGNIIRRDAWIDQLRQQLPISEELVHRFYVDHPELFVPMAPKRVIRLTLTPSNTVPLPAQTRMEMDKILANAAGAPVMVTVKKREQLDEEKDGLIYDANERVKDAFDMMARPEEDMNFYTNQAGSTETLQMEQTEPLPSLEGEPAPGLETIDTPSDVTTDTLQSLEDRPAQTDTLDLVTTTPQGGAAPGSASGGIGGELGGEDILPDIRKPIQPTPTPDPDEVKAEGAPLSLTPLAPAEPKKVMRATEEVEVGPVVKEPAEADVRPAQRPHGGAVPAAQVVPAVPALNPEPTPNIRKQLKPPPTSNLPYNPDWFYARREFSSIQSIIGKYASSDWLLTMDDLGYVYLEDMPDVPFKVRNVPVGAFTRPILRGVSAVAWYIEAARTVAPQAYDEIKTHVYDVYRTVQIDKKVSQVYNSELDKADIDYRF